MKYHKLRIAWSVAWGVVAVLLVVLWGRSYWGGDSFSGQVSRTNLFEINSHNGVVGLTLYGPDGLYDPSADMGGVLNPTNWWLTLPYWILSALSASLLVIPWIRWSKRFSLRTLLIVTTLIAVGLGVAVWSAR